MYIYIIKGLQPPLRAVRYAGVSYIWCVCGVVCQSINTCGNKRSFSAFYEERKYWLFNFVCHVKLAMNASNKKSRLAGFPLFSYVTMPHYFFEVLSWVGFNMTLSWQCLAREVFMCVGALIMTCWAVQKHEAYGSRETPHTPIFPLIDIRPPRAVVDALAK